MLGKPQRGEPVATGWSPIPGEWGKARKGRSVRQRGRDTVALWEGSGPLCYVKGDRPTTTECGIPLIGSVQDGQMQKVDQGSDYQAQEFFCALQFNGI
jgi:hypothetical protein